MPTATPTPIGPPPQILGGASAGSTVVQGTAVPNLNPDNNCIDIVCCDPAGCGQNDHVIGTGDVDAQGMFAVVVAPPLEPGKEIYARDRCTGQTGEPLLISLATVAPAASPLVVVALAVVLASVAVWAISRRRGAHR